MSERGIDMSTNVKMRRVTEAVDMAEVATLAAKIWREYYVSIITLEQIDYMLDKFQSIDAITTQIRDEGYEYYLMELAGNSDRHSNNGLDCVDDQIREGGQTVGYMAVRAEWESEEAANDATKYGKLFLSKFYVSKEHRGQGYASQAIAFLEKLCRSRNLSHIWLTVNRYNAASIAIYKKKGFKVVRELAADIGNGFVMDDYIMEKSIF